MQELVVVANVAIVFGVIYKLFDLYVRRRERIMLIERMGTPETPDALKKGGAWNPSELLGDNPSKFTALRVGCLLTGLGAGLLIGFFILYAIQLDTDKYYDSSVIYGACVLLGGGAGLLISYIIEHKQSVKKDKEEAPEA